MSNKEIIAQIFGIIGLIIIVYSFQCRRNKNFFLMQGIGSFMFFVNFIIIGAVAGALFNLSNLVRGLLFSNNAKKPWKLIVTEALYTVCFVFSIVISKGDLFEVFLSALPYVALIIMSVFMWNGNPKHIRYSQVIYMSPAWIVHNIFNLSLGGIICESFNMISSVIALMRYRKNS